MFKLHDIRDAICKQHHVRIYQKQMKDGIEGSAVACLMFAKARGLVKSFEFHWFYSYVHMSV